MPLVPCFIDVLYDGDEYIPLEIWRAYRSTYFCGDIEAAEGVRPGDLIRLCEASDLTMAVFSVGPPPNKRIRFVSATNSWTAYLGMCKTLFECGFDAPALDLDENFWEDEEIRRAHE